MKSSTKNYIGSKKGAARFARDTVLSLKPDCASIMIMSQTLFGDYAVHIAIEGSLDDIGRLLEKSSSKQQLPTLEDLTQTGSSLPKLRSRVSDVNAD